MRSLISSTRSLPRRLRTSRARRMSLERLEDRQLLSTISVSDASLNEIGDVSAFVAGGSGGLSSPRDLVLGPDGNVYVASSGSNSVVRYTPGGQLLSTFVAAGSGGLNAPFGLAFGPDGNLYVGSEGTNAIYEYSGSTGAFLTTFVPAGAGGLNDPKGLAFGRDGNLYVSSRASESVLRYQGPSGASPGSPLPVTGQTGATFVAPSSGGLQNPNDLTFDPNGNLDVASAGIGVLQFNGNTGAYITTLVAAGTGGLVNPRGMAFDQDGRLYVADIGSNAIHRYTGQGQYLDDPITSAASSLREPVGMIVDAQGALLVSSRDTNLVGRYDRGVTVTLSAASSTPVSATYGTADGTATAPLDYSAQTGTVTFAPGQTSRLVLLVTHEDSAIDGSETFGVQLSNPTNATIATGTATVTITDPNRITGTVFNDLNGNGALDAGESGLSGWTVFIDPNLNGILDNGEPYAVTDANGNFSLDNLNGYATGPGGVTYLSIVLQVGTGGRWLNTTQTFAANNPQNTPNPVSNFGVQFQPTTGAVPAGGETQVNVNSAGALTGEYGGSGQPSTSVAADSNGDYAVAWRDYVAGGTDSIIARVFNADGSARTGEIVVGTAPDAGNNSKQMPQVAMSNGTFAVAWTSSIPSLGSASTLMRVYQSNGNALTGAVYVFQGTTKAEALMDGIAMNANGAFAVEYGKSTYNTRYNTWSTPTMTVQLYTSAGLANGKPISGATPGVVNYDTGITMDATGNFVVAWDSGGVYAQRYTASGSKNGTQITVASPPSSGYLALGSVAMNGTGQFVLDWYNGSGSTPQTMAEVYNASGSPSGGTLSFAGNQANIGPAELAIDGAGNCTFTWTSAPPLTSEYPYPYGQIRYIQLTAAGQLSPESIANTTTAGGHYGPAVAATGNGAFVIVWQGNGVGNNLGLFAQRFTPGPQIGSLTASPNSVAPGGSVTLTASNITDPTPGGTITQVAIYVDANGDKQLDGGDTLLGYAVLNSNGTWTFTLSTTGWAAGTYRLFGQAEDSSGLFSDPFAVTLTVT